MADTITALHWTDEQNRVLRDAYEHLDGREQLAALAAEIGVSPDAAHRQAARLGLQRPVSATRRFDADQDALLRRCMRLAETPVQGFADAASQLQISERDIRARWRILERRRRLRVGDWTEHELSVAVKDGQVPGRSADETALRLMSMGVRAVADERLTLGDIAGRLGLPAHRLRQAVLAGELAAVRAPDAGPLPDPQWVSTERRVGAWLIACPDLLAGAADHRWALRTVFACGIKVGEAMAANTPAAPPQRGMLAA